MLQLTLYHIQKCWYCPIVMARRIFINSPKLLVYFDAISKTAVNSLVSYLEA